VVVGDFNTPLSTIYTSSRPKKKKEILELNDTINLMELADVYRVFHPTTAQYTFFLAAYGTFSKTDHILGHKASLNKYKKTEITPVCYLIRMQNTRTQQQKHQEKIGKQLEAEHTAQQSVGHRRNKGGNQKFLEFNENDNTTYQNLWDTAKAVLIGKLIAMSACIKNTEKHTLGCLK
jgi:hypothetical protein